MEYEPLLHYASHVYTFNKDTLKFISHSTNRIYMFEKDGKGYILRLSQRPADQKQQIKAEMDWLKYLAGHGMNVSLPLAAANGQLAVSAENEGEHFIISAFEMASGSFWDKNSPDKWNADIFHAWGAAMGRLHKLTKDYVPADPNDIRETFDGGQALSDSIMSCPIVSGITEELISKIMKLPRDRDSFGLIHYDVHPWNFYIDNGSINLFDFDDSLYGWFSLDIGIALYHGLWWGRPENPAEVNEFIAVFVRSFLKGYLSENKLDDFWLGTIPMFMRFRQICKLSWFYSPADEGEHQRERIRNIEGNILFTGCRIGVELFTKAFICGGEG